METIDRKDSAVIVKDVHCPYCDSDQAVLINRVAEKGISLYFFYGGLKFILCLMFLNLLYIYEHGFKFFEARKRIASTPYVFCPRCGNSFMMKAPEDESVHMPASPKFYRQREGKILGGLCRGISEYIDMPVWWIRLVMVIYCLLVIGIIFYLAGCLGSHYREDEGRN